MIVRSDPPIPGALIVLEKEGKIVASAITDSEGKAILSARPGTYTLWVAKENYLVYKETVDITKDLSLSLVLKSGIFIGYGLPYDIEVQMQITVEATTESTDLSVLFAISVETEVA